MSSGSSIGIIGCGYIGYTLAKAVDDGTVPNSKVLALYDIDQARCASAASSLKSRPRASTDFEELISDSRIDLIVEASSQKAVELYIPRALAASKNVMIMSIGALVDEKLRQEIYTLASRNGNKVYLPSGAIAGLDCIKAAGVGGGLRRVMLTTRKPPRALAGAPGTQGIDLSSISKPKIVYQGSAREAVKLFPSNVNVAASISLAGLGFEKTEVKIIADPAIERNVHEVVAEGTFGRLTALVENEPSMDNPKTSQLASLSAVRKLIEISQPIQLGT